MIVVIDTNVIISGQLIKAGYQREVYRLWKARRFQVALSEELLAEYQRVLGYERIQKRLGWSTARQQEFIEDLRDIAIVVSGKTAVDVSSDPDDNKLFACAIEAQANFIISGDEHHVLSVPSFQGIRTISAKDFINMVLARPKAQQAA